MFSTGHKTTGPSRPRDLLPVTGATLASLGVTVKHPRLDKATNNMRQVQWHRAYQHFRLFLSRTPTSNGAFQVVCNFSQYKRFRSVDKKLTHM